MGDAKYTVDISLSGNALPFVRAARSADRHLSAALSRAREAYQSKKELDPFVVERECEAARSALRAALGEMLIDAKGG